MNKENKDITVKERLDHMNESITTGLKNVQKEIRVNETLLELLLKDNKEELKELIEKVKNQLSQLQTAFESMKNHKTIISNLLHKVENEEMYGVLSDIFTLLLRQ